MSPSRDTPLYQQVKDFIRKRIESGDWPEDHRVPSENELVRTLNVSRMTVNRAVRELTAQGLLRRMQGVGTFVTDIRPRAELFEIRNIADEIKERGHRHDCDIHLQAEETVKDTIAFALGLEPGSRIFHSIVVHREEGIPVQLEDRYVNPAVGPDYLSIDFTVTTPNEYLMRAAPLQEVEHTLEAVLPEPKTQALLQISANEPCLLLHRRTWSGNQVASRAWLTYPSSHYRLGAHFTPGGGSGKSSPQT